LPKLHGLLGAVFGNVFQDIGIGVSVWMSYRWWHTIHVHEGIARFERELGVLPRRWDYNDRCLGSVVRDGNAVRGMHCGFGDLFVPVQGRRRVEAVLVAGQFAIAPPSARDVLDKWYALSGVHGRLSDPVFARYLNECLSLLRLDGPLLDSFERLLTCYASMLGGQGAAGTLGREAAAARETLASARLPEQMWDAARKLVDERLVRPLAPLDHSLMAALGFNEIPQHAVVCLASSRREDADPIDDRIRCAEFQRAAVMLARKRGGALCGRVGESGVMLLVDSKRSAARLRLELGEIADRISALARRFELRLHAGLCAAAESSTLDACYHGALRAAEQAQTSGRSVVNGEPRSERTAAGLRKLRAELGKSVGDSAALLTARFNRYVAEVLAHTGHHLESTRVQLEVGLERLVEPLLASGVLEPRSFERVVQAFERESAPAASVAELLGAYRQIVSDIESTLERPTRARHERGTRQAVEFLREHLAEPVTLPQVARVAGFAPDYFTRLFKREEGISLGRYLLQLRVERAKQLLAGTPLSVEQVRKASGFRTRAYFHRAFKKAVGKTPAVFREWA
jgi:AraC-like DNA-binding protein